MQFKDKVAIITGKPDLQPEIPPDAGEVIVDKKGDIYQFCGDEEGIRILKWEKKTEDK